MQVTSLGHAGMLITTRQGSIVCDPWFLPAFLGSWFVFPRNDQLPDNLMARVHHADYLYISHLHADHFDEPWLTEHIRRDITVLLPQYPTRELERRIRALGFTTFMRTINGEELDLGDGLTVAIHTETSITDGPGGDSALVVSDGVSRVVNQNDCRTADLGALRAHGPVDLQWLQYSGAIWYPMVYHESDERMRELIAAKVDSQYQRALRYVESIGARAVVPSAGPPCFLDPDLQHLNVVTGDEPSIFPDQSAFLPMLAERGFQGLLAIPGSTITVTPEAITVTHLQSDEQVERIFSHKHRYLADYAADWAPWLQQLRASWSAATPDLLDRLAAWWEPLLALAPTLCNAVGSAVLIRADDIEIVVDFPHASVRRPYSGETFRYGFEIPRELVETVAAERAVDWSNALFLSCRFRAWREGPFNEYVYNFFKSLSAERMRRTESEAQRKLAPPDPNDHEEVELGGYLVERFCPHRQADLAVFGEIDETGVDPTLVCTLHGWRFDLATGRCLTATDRSLRVRRSSDRSTS